MRLRIVQPLPRELEGVPLTHLRFGASYDFGPPLYDLLLVAGYGVPADGPGGTGTERDSADDRPIRKRKRRAAAPMTKKMSRD